MLKQISRAELACVICEWECCKWPDAVDPICEQSLEAADRVLAKYDLKAKEEGKK